MPILVLSAASGFEWFSASRSVAVESYLTRLLKDPLKRTNIERDIKRERKREHLLPRVRRNTPKHSAELHAHMSLHNWSRNAEP